MLTRVYIDNFRCFEKFEYRPARKQLILGGNGSGKSSLMSTLFGLRLFALRGKSAGDLFGPRTRTHWLGQSLQNFEIEAALDGETYLYRLAIESGGVMERAHVDSEILESNGKPVFEFKAGEVHYCTDSDREVAYPYDQGGSALATISPYFDMRSVLRFRRWLSSLDYFEIDPFGIGARAESEDALPEANLSNLAAWYRYLVKAHPEAKDGFLADLRAVLDDFNLLRLEPAGENVRLLFAEFGQQPIPAKFRFDELSLGQRCLVCLYAILHFVVAKGGTVIIDEPENFISLREIQPWLMAADDMADDHKGQVLLISHHPGLIDQWAPSHGVQFIRDGIGPVRVEPFRGQPESPLSASELVARGWERE